MTNIPKREISQTALFTKSTPPKKRKKKMFSFIYVCLPAHLSVCVSACLFVYHVYAMPTKPEEGIQFSGTGV